MSIERFHNRRQIMKTIFWSGLAAGAGFTSAFPSASLAQASTERVPRTFKFNLSLSDDKIGTHEIIITQDGTSDIWHHETNINVSVSLGIFGDITYDHHCVEEWENGRLRALMSKTNDDGEKFQVTGQATGSDFVTQGPDGQYRSPRQLMTTNSLWTENFCAQDEVIDAATGGVIGVVIDPINNRRRSRTEKQQQLSSYDVVSAKITGELLYDTAGIWSGGILQKNGQEIKYEQVR